MCRKKIHKSNRHITVLIKDGDSPFIFLESFSGGIGSLTGIQIMPSCPFAFSVGGFSDRLFFLSR
jgi:hypothetical protein